MHARVKLLIAIMLVLGSIAALVWALSPKPLASRTELPAPLRPDESPARPSPAAQPAMAVPSPLPAAEPAADTHTRTEGAPALPSASTPAPPTQALANPAALLIPVAGVRPEQLRDTFTESRSSGRTHDAIDIEAPRGTPVLAAADGRVVKFFQSIPGGTTIYQLGTDEHTIYYYAHLDRYADGLKEGDFVRRGDVIAYVGDTGNAGAGNYHLHFSILIVSDPKRYWDGTNINPYPLLRGEQK